MNDKASPSMESEMQKGHLVIVAAAGAAGVLLLSSCGSPTAPTIDTWGNPVYLDTPDCTNVEVSSEPCDESYERPSLPDLPCPPREEVEAIQHDFRVYVNHDVSAGTLVCRAADGSADLTMVQENVCQSLLFLRRLTFDRPVPWTSLSVYDWTRAVTSGGIYIESTGYSHAYLNSRTIHVAFTSAGGLRRSIDGLIAGLIAHEGRHAEGWPHTCGLTADNGNVRDMSIAEMGAFGVDYLLHYWIGHYSGEPADVRQFALRRAAVLRQGGGTFCCECGGLRRASAPAPAEWTLFQQPGQYAMAAGRVEGNALSVPYAGRCGRARDSR